MCFMLYECGMFLLSLIRLFVLYHYFEENKSHFILLAVVAGNRINIGIKSVIYEEKQWHNRPNSMRSEGNKFVLTVFDEHYRNNKYSALS